MTPRTCDAIIDNNNIQRRVVIRTRRIQRRQIVSCRRRCLHLSLFLFFILIIPSTNSSFKEEEEDKSLNIVDHNSDNNNNNGGPFFGGSSNSNDHGNQQQQQQSLSSSSFIVCSVDGSVYTLDADTGNIKGVFKSDSPLVAASSLSSSSGNESNNNDYEENLIIPGLDGRLYALQRPPPSVDDDDSDDDDDDDDQQPPHLEPLPLTVMDVLTAPFRTCSATNPSNCGIVTGTKITSLYAFDSSTGLLQWTQESSASGGGESKRRYHQQKKGEPPPQQQQQQQTDDDNNNDKEEEAAAASTENVLLQREDYVVRHISSNTGEEVWNASVSHFVSLDFDDFESSMYHPNPQYQTKDQRFPMMLPNGGNRLLPHQQPPSISPTLSVLPSIGFDDEKTLTAIDIETKAILWTRSWDHVIASVHGVGGDNWINPDVVDIQQLLLEEVHTDINNNPNEFKSTIVDADTSVAPYFTPKQQKQHDDYVRLLLNQNQRGGSFVPPNRQNGFETSNGLIIYEEPTAREVIQTNMKLKRLGDKVLFVSPNKNKQEIAFSTNTLLPNGEVFLGPLTEQQLSDRSSIYVTNDGNNDDLTKPPGMKPQQYHHLPGSSEEEQNQFGGPTRWNGSITLQDYHEAIQQGVEGLFLTWTVVYVIVAFLISIVVGFRIYYVRQKRKWQASTVESNSKSGELNEASHEDRQKLNGYSSDNDGKLRALHLSNHDSATIEKESNDENGKVTKAKTNRIILRCHSLPHNMNSSSNNQKPMIDKPPAPFKTPQPSKLKRATTATTAATTTTGGTSADSNSFLSSIDGVPMVRYARYKSEFNELSPLGKGGFGTVFRCTNALDGREYAVKKVWINSETDSMGNLTKEFSQRLQRVLREVKILALLDHPNVVRYYTAWLELEKDNDDNHDIAAVELDSYLSVTPTDKRKSTMCFSSDLLAGAEGTSTWTPTANEWRNKPGLSRTGRVGKSQSSSNKHPQAPNPLGWNTFQLEGNILDSPRYCRKTSSKSLDEDSDDCGFTFERSASDASGEKCQAGGKNNTLNGLPAIKDNDGSDDSSWADSSSDEGSVSVSSSDEELEESSFTPLPPRKTKSLSQTNTKQNMDDNIDARNCSEEKEVCESSILRHTLYIQMQLCSQKTLADFLANAEARTPENTGTSSASESSVDIPYALSLFKQIAQGVKHVHEQGLIHRDLKPQNCFIDDAVVKVGDFGLSRGSSTGTGEDREGVDDLDTSVHKSVTQSGDDNTAGVGTRMYASPEQIMGSDYDASTDVYSLGLMLFELCYPMYTGMERHIVFDGLRKHKFPKSWHEKVVGTFPSLHSLLTSMLSSKPSERPSADSVSQHIESLLGEYTVLSLDRHRHQMDGTMLLRVEGKPEEGVLAGTIKLIKEAAPGIEIVQYGMRSQVGKTIMEFALTTTDDDEDFDGNNNDDSDNSSSKRRRSNSLGSIMERMRQSSSINLVRQVSDVHH